MDIFPTFMLLMENQQPKTIFKTINKLTEMRKRLLLIAAAGIFLASSCMEDRIGMTGDETTGMHTVSQGQLRLKVTEELAAALEANADENGTVTFIGVRSSDDKLSGLGFKSMTRTFPYAGKFEARTREEGLHLWYDVELDGNTPLTRAQDGLSQIEGVDMVEYIPALVRPEYKIVDIEALPRTKADGLVFDDPRLSNQWHYYNDGSYKGTAGCDINVMPVWANGIVGSDDVIVCVVDGGVDVDHEDLAPNIWVNEAELNGEPGVDDDGNGYIDDINGFDFVTRKEIVADEHGTHVAGTIAAVNNNGIGVCGVAGGDAKNGIKGARIMSSQIFIGKRSGNSANAIKYGADNGAVISQNSWGYSGGSMIPSSDKAAIDYFIKYAGVDENGNQTGPMKGGVVFFAAGNDELPYGSPAQYESAVAVSAIAADFEAAYYTNYGEWCDICAPGGDAYKGQYVLSTTKGNKYVGMQGTSMACPHVSGVAALIVSWYGGPGFTNEDLKKKLSETVNDIIYNGHNSQFQGKLGAGLLDASAALKGSSTVAPDKVADLTAEPSVTEVTLRWTVPSDQDDTKPAGFTVYSSKTSFDPASVKYDKLPEGVSKFIVRNSGEAGSKVEYIVTGLEDNCEYFFAVDAYDLSANHSAVSAIASTKTLENFAPEVTATIPDQKIAGAGFIVSLDLSKYITDKNNEKLAFTCTTLPEGIVETGIKGDTLTIKGLKAGTSIAYVEAADNTGMSVKTSFKLSVLKDIEYLCYPNPVRDILNVSNASETPVKTRIAVTSGKGSRVYDAEHEISAAAPARIDMSGMSSGNYTVEIRKADGTTTSQNIIKI